MHTYNIYIPVAGRIITYEELSMKETVLSCTWDRGWHSVNKKTVSEKKLFHSCVNDPFRYERSVRVMRYLRGSNLSTRWLPEPASFIDHSDCSSSFKRKFPTIPPFRTPDSRGSAYRAKRLANDSSRTIDFGRRTSEKQTFNRKKYNSSERERKKQSAEVKERKSKKHTETDREREREAHGSFSSSSSRSKTKRKSKSK